MPKVSRNNSYYRYKISTLQDIKVTTIERRFQKAKQNSANTLLFDWTDFSGEPSQSLHEAVLSFLCEIATKTQTADLHYDFLFKPHQIEFFLKNSEIITQIKKNILTLHLKNKKDWITSLKVISDLNINPNFILQPQTKNDLQELLSLPQDQFNQSWDFTPYRSELKNSLTLKDLVQTQFQFQRRPGLEIWNSNIPTNYELEAIQPITWQFSSPNPRPEISLIIPSFNNVSFLSNVIHHLIQQNISADRFEVIIVEDGGTDNTSDILKDLWSSYQKKFNLKFIYWSKKHPQHGAQNFFRAGLARNLASQYSQAEYLFFLDSDMLTPPDFIETSLAALKKYDVIQFQRFHIQQNISQKQPVYTDISIARDTYIEEAHYWNQLFTSSDWMSLKHHWKFTCTYALGLKKSEFLEVGRFKKYYVSYGFEDTDLGYELYKRKKTFFLVPIPLYHLTAYNQMQYQNSQLKRLKLLRKTAELFYLQHLNPEIYHLFGNFYRFQKKLPHYIRDLF